MGKEKIIPILALIVILICGTSTAYVYVTQINKDTITINGQEYSVEQIFYIGVQKTIQTVDGEKKGISLEDMITKVGVGCPSCHEYIIKGKDGYQKTVNWDIMKTGVLADNKRVFFPDTPKAFWVSDIVEIEVK
jgi:hypothetical protein